MCRQNGAKYGRLHCLYIDDWTVCVLCSTQDVVADMVHHITEIEEDWTQRLNVENLFPLSNGNHGIISALYKKDEATKRQTQELLRNIIRQHWKGAGGIEKVLTGLD